MALKTGTKAPAITLKSKTASGLVDVALTRNVGKGQTVLLFVPFAFTGVCSDELCSITKNLNAYRMLDADVIAVSVDNPFAQEAWAEKAGIGFTLASDFNKEAIKAYDVYEENFLPGALGYKGVAKRSAFVIGSDGVIKYSWSSDDPKNLPPFEEVQAVLRA